jgi:hypothetical protein
MTAPVFLSASEPDPERSREYWNTRKLLNLREAVRAFCAHVLPHFPLVFGGHPAITPLVRGIAERFGHDAGLDRLKREGMLSWPEVMMFQSGLYVGRPALPDEHITEPLDREGNVMPPRNGWRNESLLLMRYEMLALPTTLPVDAPVRRYTREYGAAREARFETRAFSAAVFIGGMEGVEREFRIFRSFHPGTPAFPIASTGSACEKLLGELEPRLDKDLAADLRGETAYSLLMQQILPPPSRARSIAEAVAWRGAEAPEFNSVDHRDPADLNVQFINGVRQPHVEQGS